MDLRVYYQKIRDVEKTMPSPHVVVASLATPDGGKEGVFTEVPTAIAARMVVDGFARQATVAEFEAFREQQEAARQAAEDAAAAARLQVVVVPATNPARQRPGKEQ